MNVVLAIARVFFADLVAAVVFYMFEGHFNNVTFFLVTFGIAFSVSRLIARVMGDQLTWKWDLVLIPVLYFFAIFPAIIIVVLLP